VPDKALYEGKFNEPMLWNSSFFMTLESMKILRVLAGVWLPDFKFGPGRCAMTLAKTPWYWETVTKNLALIAGWGEDYSIRHLVMPNHVECCTYPVLWSRLLALALLLLPAPALAGVKEKVTALAPSGVVLVVDSEGNELVAQKTDEPFVPASVTKIVTAWLALEVLGGDYRFETRFYLDDKRVLYVRGGGDPFLISEELGPLATDLVAVVGKKPIDGIVLDASYYPSNLSIPGIEDTNNAYDALMQRVRRGFGC
jgi:hypothetical protein